MVQRISEKISQLQELGEPTGEMYVPVVMGSTTYKTEISSLLGRVFDVRSYGATPFVSTDPADVKAAQASANVVAIQRAIDAAEVSGGIVSFPGSPDTRYAIDGTLTITASNVKLWAPGGARLLVYSAIPVLIAVGDIETGVNLTQGNTLASNATAGSSSIALTAGKGANITAGSWVMVKSLAVVPEHDSAVVNKRAEFVNVYSVSTDTLTLASPLRFTYNTADSAEVFVINWIEGFAVSGLGIDGNNQTDCSIAIQLSWCLAPQVSSVVAENLQQRFVRFQGCLFHRASGVRQSNGLSNGFNGDTGHFSYVTAEQGLCQGGIIENVQADRCRHAYTTGAGWTDNAASTSAIISGVGVPMDTIVASGIHMSSRGAGWDTHEVGMDITFRDLKTLGSMELGFQVRSVRTRFVGDCLAKDCVGAALQIGSDAQDTIVKSLDWQNTNTGTTSVDWTKQSPIVDNSPRSYLGEPAANELDNGNFDLWDRGSSFSASGGTANRWKFTLGSGATASLSRQAHATGSASGAESGLYYARLNRTTTGSGACLLSQYTDNLRQFAGQRVVLSFDAKASVDGTDIQCFIRQYFGTGGSPSADVDTAAITRKIGDQWHRYTVVFDVPSISGKTIGSNEDSACVVVLSLPTAAGVVILDVDRVKLEVGRTPTSFVPLPLAVEAERCKRWYEKSYLDAVAPGTATSVGAISQIAPVAASTYGRAWVPFGARKGRVPTVTLYSTDGTSGNVRNVTTAANIAGAVTDSSGAQLHGWYGGANAAGVNVGDLLKWHWTAAVADFE